MESNIILYTTEDGNIIQYVGNSSILRKMAKFMTPSFIIIVKIVTNLINHKN